MCQTFIHQQHYTYDRKYKNSLITLKNGNQSVKSMNFFVHATFKIEVSIILKFLNISFLVEIILLDS